MCTCLGHNSGKVVASRGMEVNDSVGKTEVLLRFNGTGVAKVREALDAGTQKIGTGHFVFGCIDIGITQQYKHLGSMNAVPHQYDQEIESRVGQARTINKALRRTLFANKGLQRQDRLTAWKAFILSKRIFDAATWGTLTVEHWKKIEATYQQGLRIIHGETKYVALQYGTRINLGIRADLKVRIIQQSISAIRLGLFKRILDSNSEWLLGLIMNAWDHQRGLATEIQKDLKWLAKLEIGVSPSGTIILTQAKATTNKRWKNKSQDGC